MTRSLRKLAAWLGLAAFVFAQVITVAYACPLGTPEGTGLPTGSEALSSVGDARGAADHCAGHATDTAPDPATACATHCGSQQVVQTPTAPTLPPLALAPFPFVVSIVATLGDVGLMLDDVNPLGAAAPPQLRYTKLLI